jgi:putative endonuclease
MSRSDRLSQRLSARPGLGRRAEDLAVAHLERAGLHVVARNWRRPEGELDIIADDEGTCVFVEVRSRTGDQQGHPLESITPRKQARVIRAARLYLAERTETVPAPSGLRFDVVSIIFDPQGHDEPVLEHVANAFEVD